MTFEVAGFPPGSVTRTRNQEVPAGVPGSLELAASGAVVKEPVIAHGAGPVGLAPVFVPAGLVGKEETSVAPELVGAAGGGAVRAFSGAGRITNSVTLSIGTVTVKLLLRIWM